MKPSATPKAVGKKEEGTRSCPHVANVSDYRERAKKKHHCMETERDYSKDQGKQQANRGTWNKNTLPAAAAVCGASSVSRF